jgi:hypothetical protein
VSGGNRFLLNRNVVALEYPPETGTERAVVDGAANLEK